MRSILFTAVVLLLVVVPAQAQPGDTQLCFDVPGVTNCIDGRFRQYWEQNGGLPVFGYPISVARNERTAEGTFLTQYFERTRFELHPEKSAPYHVLLGRIGADRLAQLDRDWRTEPKGQQTTDCYWFAETGHSVCDQAPGVGFRSYWRSHGLNDPAQSDYANSLLLFGYPLTEAREETNANGDKALTQWFERARFEYHPGNPSASRVLLGLLGVEVSRIPRPPTEPPPIEPDAVTLKLESYVSGLTRPTYATHAGDGSSRLFVVEKRGVIRIIANDQLQPRPFLDITNLVGSAGGEQGLLSLAFHPQYRSNGRLYVYYTNKAGDIVIARYQVSPDPNVAAHSTGSILLTIDHQAYNNHNGGQLAFGPDGYLYIGTGDGGSAGDPFNNAPNRNVLLGKLLRINVNGAEPYTIPADNPFVGVAGARPEIWAYGLRNPWRFSFDRVTGDLYIADVGQNTLEELHFQSARSKGGEHYGWSTLEGSACYKPKTNCNREGLQLPIAEYNHDLGCSITGGYRYRGRSETPFANAYFFGDFCSGRIWSLHQRGGEWITTPLINSDLQLSSFAEDEAGEIYAIDFRGALYRLEAE